LEPLDKKLSKYIGGNPIRVDGKPRASGILDTVSDLAPAESHLTYFQIRAASAHDIKVPSEFEDKTIVNIIVCSLLSACGWFTMIS
jgi:acid phosphatase